jgi:hypothetical protein
MSGHHAAHGFDEAEWASGRNVLPLERIPWIAAPMATTSSGLRPCWSCLPRTSLHWPECLRGMRVQRASPGVDVGPVRHPAACFTDSIERLNSVSTSFLLELSAAQLTTKCRTEAVAVDVFVSVSRRRQLPLWRKRLPWALEDASAHVCADPATSFSRRTGRPGVDDLIEIVAAEVGVAVGAQRTSSTRCRLKHQ